MVQFVPRVSLELCRIPGTGEVAFNPKNSGKEVIPWSGGSFPRRCQEFCVNGVWIDALFFNAVFLAPQASGAVGKWESWFWISTFPWPTILLAVASVSPL